LIEQESDILSITNQIYDSKEKVIKENGTSAMKLVALKF
jgi:hypothetical protein